MLDIYGTLGPACDSVEILEGMFRSGMTGVRLNLSHVTLEQAQGQIQRLHQAAQHCGLTAKLLIDMQGPELRVGALERPIVSRIQQERYLLHVRTLWEEDLPYIAKKLREAVS